MKVKIYTAFIAVIFTTTLSAQIPNGSFESWNGTNMQGWVSTNGLMLLGNNQSVFQSADAHEGSYACEMISTKVTNKPGPFVPDYVCSIFIGKQVGFTSIPGFAYTEKPEKLEFWYKCAPKTNDTANAIVALTRWNTQTSKRDTVAIGFFWQSTIDTLAYKKGTIMLTYMSPETPDTAMLVFSAATFNCSQDGSRFLVDDMKFTGGTVGVKKPDTINAFSVYPNPSTDRVHVQFANIPVQGTMQLLNILGQEVYSTPLGISTDYSIPVSALKNGIYFLRINNGENSSAKKIEISH